MRRYAPYIVILAVTAAVYAVVWSGGFLRDDFPVITENPWITSPSYIPEIFSSTLWGFYEGDFITTTSNYYRPMMYMVFMAAYALFGLDPTGYHAINLAFHILNAFMVFLIAAEVIGAGGGSGGGDEARGKRDAKTTAVSLAAALMFALHPVNAEPTVWVGAIGELTFTFFFMLAFYLFMLSARGRGALFFAASLSSYAVALFAKETAIVVAPLFFLFALASGDSVVKAARRSGAYLAAAGLFVLLRSTIVGPMQAEHAMGAWQYLLSMVTLTAQYVEKLIFPFDISLYYPFHAPASLGEIMGHELAVLLLAAAAVVLWAWRSHSRRSIVFFVLWIFAALSPPILMVKYIQGEWVFAARYLYFSTAGLAMLAAIGLSRLLEGRSLKAVGAAFVVVVLLPFAIESARVSLFWADEFSFWKKAAEDAPSSPTTHASLGVAFANKKMYPEAIEAYQRALSYAPESEGLYNNLGVAYYAVKDYGRAAESFSRALSLAKDQEKAASLSARIGLIYLEAGEPRMAIPHLERAASSGAADGNTHNFLGVAYASTGQGARAFAEFSEALRVDPGNEMARRNLERLTAGGEGAR